MDITHMTEQQVRCARHELRLATSADEFVVARERLARALGGELVYRITVGDGGVMSFSVDGKGVK